MFSYFVAKWGFLLMAYQNIYANKGNMTAGTNGQTIDAMSLDRINRIIDSLKDEKYVPNPARRTYIPKKNGKLRPPEYHPSMTN